MVVKWNIGTTPDSILVNKMLEDAKAASAYIKAENSALEGYKAYLTGLVDKIDVSIYGRDG